MTGVAVVGIACEYPEAHTPGELWENVLAQRRAFRRFPRQRLDLADYHSTDPSRTDLTYAVEGAFLSDWEFDRVRFRVAGRTFRSADPAHWLALDVADRALADAGFPGGEGLERDAVGVVLGNTLTGEFSRASQLRLRWPYVRRSVAAVLAEQGAGADETAELLARLEAAYKQPFPEMTEESLAGGLSNTIAGRICNHFDLHGGGFTVDGACASSLLAVTQACSALAAGDLDCALAGGVDLSLDPFELVGFARTGALAPREMRVFDTASEGFFPGEGCGFAVLMREADAIASGRRVYAVIRGWGVSSDGAGGITRPEQEGQLLALSRAYRRAGFGVDTIGYFEGHGTGTAVGDATELGTLTRARRAAGGSPPPAPVGSIKANIGHTKAAAGVAGLIKATLVVHHRLVPPTTGCREPHPLLAGEDATLRVVRRAEPWPERHPVHAAVSAMGFGGINAHVVLAGETAPRRRSVSLAERQLLAAPQDAEVFLFAAGDRERLAAAVERLARRAAGLSRSELTDCAAALAAAARRTGSTWRAAVVAGTPAELSSRLEELAARLTSPAAAAPAAAPAIDPRRGVFLGAGRSARVGLLFPGQGAPTRREGGVWERRFDEVRELYRQHDLPAAGDRPGGDLDTAVAQPAIALGSLAALAVLDRLGIHAAVAVGHSLGELAALCWAGALDADGLLELARERGAAMSECGLSRGAMAAIAAGADEVAAILPSGAPADPAPADPGVAVAAFNAPDSTVVSGDEEAVERVMAAARRRGWGATRLKVSHAFHSPHVVPAAERVGRALEATAFAPLRRRVVSTVSGAALTAADDLRRLLAEQVTAPVRFTEAVAAAEDVDLWIEAGPGRALSTLLERQSEGPAPAIALDAGGNSLAGLLAALGAAWSLGLPIDPQALFEDRFHRPFSFDREPEFLVNPCELAGRPEGLGGSATAPQIAAAPPAEPADGEGGDGEAVAAAADGAAADEPVEVLRRLVADRTELPASRIDDDSRLLSDLHLNSISVGQLLAEAAQRLDRSAPSSPTDYADATLVEAARALADGPRTEAAPERYPPGVDSWVRAFSVEWVEEELRSAATGATTGGTAVGDAAGDGTDGWQVVGPTDHPLAPALARELAEVGGEGVALVLPPPPVSGCFDDFDLLVEAADDLLAEGAPRRLLVVHRGGGGGFARTAHLEIEGLDTCVVDIPFDHPEAARWAAAEMVATDGYSEARYERSGRRTVPVLTHLPVAREAEIDLGEDDVLLVTGGGRGIAAECALDLARRTGARLALIGRSSPDESPELTANLERLAAAGVTFLYASADVTDGGRVADAVAAMERELGPVTGVLHGAGRNRPQLLGELDPEAFSATLAPKLTGLSNVLSAVDLPSLRLLVTFGSIIARSGMRGEADYAAANEWQTLFTERFAAANPHCRCLAVEWSVWSGVGMGERLGRLEGLMREGIIPISPERGTALLADLLASPDMPVAVVVSGRYGELPTLRTERRELPLARFLERPRVHVPGVELVVECEVSGDSDPYLDDHVFRGERLLPAVMGLEAMAQAAAAIHRPPAGAASASAPEIGPPVFESIELERPIVVGDGESVTLRVAALERSPGRVETVLRAEGTGFAVDCFRAVCRFDLPNEPVRRSPPEGEPLPLSPGEDLYGGLFFHRGRFRRVTGYRRISARGCLAEIGRPGSLDGEVAAAAATWFGRYLPGDLLLGDPGARDAVLHGIQVCVPHSTLLPVGAERIVAGRLPADGSVFLDARQRRRDGDLFVYDAEVLAADGTLIERWEGLRLKAVDAAARPTAWRPELVAPYVERRLEELLAGSHPSVHLTPGNGREASDRAARAALGYPAAVRRRPDGRPEVVAEGAGDSDDGAGRAGRCDEAVSMAHAGDWVLAVAGRGAVGCDLEPVVERDAATWDGMLGTERGRLARLIAEESGETADRSATRVWAAGEALRKAGYPADAPLVLARSAGDGWLLLKSGGAEIGTQILPVEGVDAPLAVAVLAADS